MPAALLFQKCYTPQMKQLTLLLIALLFAGGCSSQPKSLPYPLEIDSAGIASITSKTPFKVSAIGSKLLGFELQQFTFFKTGVAHPVIRVTHNREEMMLIHPSADREHIAFITVTSAKIAHRYGRIGTSFEVFQTYRPQCTAHQKELLTCHLPEVPSLEYLFENQTLAEIIWHTSPQKLQNTLK